ncbi:unnamed protein product, partial [marine sediment metagenome]
MAKLKAPLLSLGASGAIGKAIVYFPWKGLNVAREYVIPSNPQTKAQGFQRGYLKTMVADIHVVQGLDVNPLDEEDIMAYALLGSTYPTPRTWFNQIVKEGIDQLKDDLEYVIWTAGHLIPLSKGLNFQAYPGSYSGDALVSGHIYFGTSKTALYNKQDIIHADIVGGVVI